MPHQKKSVDRQQLSQVILRLIAQRGWNAVTIEAVAKAAKTPASTLKKEFPLPQNFAALLAEEIDREAFASVGKISGAVHDRFFDLLMARFDILQKNRQAVLKMAEAAQRDGMLFRALSCATLEGSYRLIDVAKMNGSSRPFLAAGLTVVYGWTFFVWRTDASRDMAKTMVALDRGLRLAGKASAFFTPRS